MTQNSKPYRDLRALDYVYDPEFIVSGQRDYAKAVRKAAAATAEFRICANFATMFSDYMPRQFMALTRIDRVPPWFDKSWEARQRAWKERLQKPVDVNKQRCFFFRRPIAPFLASTAAAQYGKEEPTTKAPEHTELVTSPAGTYVPPVMHSQGTQTKYRESEAQTLPWEPPAVVHGDGTTPEIMTLAKLSYGNGLPAGMHEVAIIDRARKRRAWEQLLPKTTDPASIKKIKCMLETMEQDEWQFREEEIQTIHEMRLELAKKLIEENQKLESTRLQKRLQGYLNIRTEEKNRKIRKIRHERDRELRKLKQRHKGVVMRYKEMNVLDEHIDKTSELYGPQMRYGVHPKRRHEVINVRSKFLSNIKGLEILESVPKPAPHYDYLRPLEPKKSYELCLRLTRWSDVALKKLYEDLRAIRTKQYQLQGPLRLIWKKPVPESVAGTPRAESLSEGEENIYQAALFLQKIIKGRAIQTWMCKGRHKCRELIEELKSTTGLEPEDKEMINKCRTRVLGYQREQMKTEHENSQIADVLGTLEGKSVGFMLDLLSKELLRLQNARRDHAFALLAERVRFRREAKESGLRKKQERRRREHDEMFKQILKVHQDTVDMYLEDIIVESMDQTADEEARIHVQALAKKIDEAAHEFQMRQDDLEKEELIADLIHSFVVPEVQKQIIREQVKKRQFKYLQEAHSTIYGHIEDSVQETMLAELRENRIKRKGKVAKPEVTADAGESDEIPQDKVEEIHVAKSDQEDSSSEIDLPVSDTKEEEDDEEEEEEGSTSFESSLSSEEP